MIGLVSMLIMFIGSLLAGVGSLMFIMVEKSVVVEWDLFKVGGVMLSSIFVFDWMSLLFTSVVLMISSMVVFYSVKYMEGDFFFNRFVLLVLLFVFSMIMVILSPSLISLLIGWDGLGLVSYCLVIYYQNSRAESAGMLTIMSNRAGDVGLLLGIGGLFSFGCWWMESFNYMDKNIYIIVIYCIMLGSLTKSAQIPFSAWLPAAMAAPTPVSALVHSSTLVTAGVYLLIRFYYAYEFSEGFKCLLLVLSILTMMLAGVLALVETDFKKIIALSTLSQLGVMMFSLSMGMVLMSFFHLLTHALFKALLFLCAGKIIHDLGGKQDIRFMGGLSEWNPVLGVSFFVANMSLSGIPFLAGFYSKDLILEFASLGSINYLLMGALMISTALTCVYSLRVVYYTMFSDFKLFKVYSFLEKDLAYMGPFVLLGSFSIVSGAGLGWALYNSYFFNYLLVSYKIWPLMVVMMGGLIGVLVLIPAFDNSKMYGFYYLMSMYYLVELSCQWVIFWGLEEGEKGYKLSDGGWVENFGGSGMWNVLKEVSKMMDMLLGSLFKVILSVGFVGMVMLMMG